MILILYNSFVAFYWLISCRSCFVKKARNKGATSLSQPDTMNFGKNEKKMTQKNLFLNVLQNHKVNDVLFKCTKSTFMLLQSLWYINYQHQCRSVLVCDLFLILKINERKKRERIQSVWVIYVQINNIRVYLLLITIARIAFSHREKSYWSFSAWETNISLFIASSFWCKRFASIAWASSINFCSLIGR